MAFLFIKMNEDFMSGISGRKVHTVSILNNL